MALAAHQLEAFIEVSRTGNLTQAAKNLRVTQSALSHRILTLEDELGAPLYLRLKTGMKLTELGIELLRYVKTKDQLESEFLARLKQENKNQLAGILRVGAYSSIGRSLVLPAIESILSAGNSVQLHLNINELRKLPEMLRSGEADFIFLDHDQAKGSLHSQLLGYEEYVLVESKDKKTIDRFLNHDEDDQMTFKYFDALGKKDQKVERSYLDEIYTVIDGVALGLGRSVLPYHLVRSDERVRIVEPKKRLKVPIYLHWVEPAVWSNLHKHVLKTFKQMIPKSLQE